MLCQSALNTVLKEASRLNEKPDKLDLDSEEMDETSIKDHSSIGHVDNKNKSNYIEESMTPLHFQMHMRTSDRAIAPEVKSKSLSKLDYRQDQSIQVKCYCQACKEIESTFSENSSLYTSNDEGNLLNQQIYDINIARNNIQAQELEDQAVFEKGEQKGQKIIISNGGRCEYEDELYLSLENYKEVIHGNESQNLNFTYEKYHSPSSIEKDKS